MIEIAAFMHSDLQIESLARIPRRHRVIRAIHSSEVRFAGDHPFPFLIYQEDGISTMPLLRAPLLASGWEYGVLARLDRKGLAITIESDHSVIRLSFEPIEVAEETQAILLHYHAKKELEEFVLNSSPQERIQVSAREVE